MWYDTVMTSTMLSNISTINYPILDDMDVGVHVMMRDDMRWHGIWHRVTWWYGQAWWSCGVTWSWCGMTWQWHLMMLRVTWWCGALHGDIGWHGGGGAKGWHIPASMAGHDLYDVHLEGCIQVHMCMSLLSVCSLYNMQHCSQNCWVLGHWSGCFLSHM